LQKCGEPKTIYKRVGDTKYNLSLTANCCKQK